MNNTIYLDNAATTFPKPECVYTNMDTFYRNNGVNAGRSSYNLSRIASNMIDETREMIGEIVNISNYNNVIFTPSATIAINQILNGLDWTKINNVYVSPFEHNAIMRTLNYLKDIHEFKIHIIDFNSESFELNTNMLKPKMAQNVPDLICISHVSNVIGLVLPIEEIIDITKEYNPIFMLDCAQSLGLIDLDLKKLKIDFAVFAGHKTLYGPFGVAGYIINSEIRLKEFIVGGTGSDSTNLLMPTHKPNIYEAGSYNVQAISGLNASLKWIKEIGIKNIYEKKKELTDYLFSKLQDIYGINIYIPKDKKSYVGIVSFNIDGYNAEDISRILDEEFNIAIRSGHHCAPLIGEFIGVQDGTVRISLGYFNNFDDIDKLIEALDSL